MSNPKFNVAIVGGGIAGLVTASSIQHFSKERKDIKIDIYESAHDFTEIGAGIAMLRRPWMALKTLGFEAALRELVPHAPHEDELADCFEMRKADQPSGLTFLDLKFPLGTLAFHRAYFLETISRALDPSTCTVHFSKKLISYTPRSSLETSLGLNFQDGMSTDVDLLIACDGIHSVTRKQMLMEVAEVYKKAGDTLMANSLLDAIEPVWSGSYAYRGMFRKDKLAALDPNHRALLKPVNYFGKNRHVIVYPVSGQNLLNVVAFVSRPDKVGTCHGGKLVEERSIEELLAHFEGWEEEVQQILRCIEKPLRWVVNNLKGLPISVSPLASSPVALLGDAAHAMTPHQGSGAGQAIEDAYILGSLLAHPLTTRSTIFAALSIYETVRLPHANSVMEKSKAFGKLYEFADPRFAGLGLREVGCRGDKEGADKDKLIGLGQALSEGYRWAWETEVEDDRKRAVKYFDEWVQSMQPKSKL